MKKLIAICLLLTSPLCFSAETVHLRGSLESIFPADQAKALSATLPMDQEVSWQAYIPTNVQAPGLFVYVSPEAGAEPPEEWIEVLEKHNLIWVSPQGFGNQVPSAQRVLAAIMGMAKVQRAYKTDNSRVYIAGFAGGGRVASILASKFPRMVTGALYVAGADFWAGAEKNQLSAIGDNRYVFMTGENDFNREDMRKVFQSYAQAGVEDALFMDLEGYGHHIPSPEQLSVAIEFLDGTLKTE